MRRLLDAAASRALTAYLISAYAVFLVFLTIWGARVPAAIVVNISKLAPFWLLYLVAAVHLLACLALFWSTLQRRCSLDFPKGSAGERIAAVPAGEWERVARANGLRLRWLAPQRSAVLHRCRWSPAGTLLFHAALLLLPVAWLVSRATRFQGEAWILEGHPFAGSRAEYTRIEPEGEFERRAPRVAFNVETVEATFWGDRLFFTDLRALIALPRGETSEARWITLPQPAWLDGARVTIRGFNYSPAFELVGPGGALVEAGDLSLRLFPPGTEDSFLLPGSPHRVWVRLYPGAQGPDARSSNRGFELTNPLFHVAVTSGKRLVSHGFRRVGEPLAFDDYRLTFTAIRRGGDLLVHRDRGYPILWVALLLALAGTVARVLFPSTRVWLERDGEQVRAVVRADPSSAGRGGRLVASLGGGAGT